MVLHNFYWPLLCCFIIFLSLTRVQTSQKYISEVWQSVPELYPLLNSVTQNARYHPQILSQSKTRRVRLNRALPIECQINSLSYNVKMICLLFWFVSQHQRTFWSFWKPLFTTVIPSEILCYKCADLNFLTYGYKSIKKTLKILWTLLVCPYLLFGRF